MSVIQAIRKAQVLTEQRGVRYVVLEETFRHHKPSYHVLEAGSWFRLQEGAPGWAARHRQVYPAVTP